MKYPNPPEINYVKPGSWVYTQPYKRCKDQNYEGRCPLWTQLRGNPDDLTDPLKTRT